MKTSIAISMTLLAFSLGACGDDNNDSSSSQSTNAQTATTGTTTSKTTTSEKKKARSSDDSKKSTSSTRRSHRRKTTNSGKGTPTIAPLAGRNKNAGKQKTPLFTKKGADDLSSQLIAKRVCQGFLPNQTEKELKKNKTTYQAVAKNFAKGWPEEKQAVAYKGCLAGLKARKVK
jgi:hypothetical protein